MQIYKHISCFFQTKYGMSNQTRNIIKEKFNFIARKRRYFKSSLQNCIFFTNHPRAFHHRIMLNGVLIYANTTRQYLPNTSQNLSWQTSKAREILANVTFYNPDKLNWGLFFTPNKNL